jgi:molybdopterin biosynthesis enzyme
VVAKGSDFAQGVEVFRRGHRLSAVDVAPLATLGVFHVRVYAAPRTMILSVGSELTDRPDRVRRSRVFIGHAYTVAELVRAAGGHPTVVRPLPDERRTIQRGLGSAARQAELILTIGGTSVSEIDLVGAALRSVAGSELVAHGVKVQPGRVCGCGHVRGVPIVLLPGLIQSTVNAFVFIALPLLRRLQGLPETRYMGHVPARLTDGLVFRRFGSFKKVTWVRLTWQDGDLCATPIIGDSSHHHVLTTSQGYVTTPEGVEHVAAGTRVEVNLVPGISRVEAPA